MSRIVIVAVCLMFVAVPDVSAQGGSHGVRGGVVWTAAGAGAGFGVGLWGGLRAFDDAVDSDRKVWTSAVVGAAVGGAAGYLIGRSRRDRAPRAAARLASADPALEPWLLRELAGTVRFGPSRWRAAAWLGGPTAPGTLPTGHGRHGFGIAR